MKAGKPDEAGKMRRAKDALEPRTANRRLAPDSSKPELDRDEFFWDDVIGLKCVLTDGKEIGKVFDVSLTAPTPVISVRRSSGVSGVSSVSGGSCGSRKATSRDILFPAIKGLIKDVSLGDGILLLDAETFSRVAVYED